METKHHMMVRDRESLEVTGIKKIESLNPDIFVLETVLGFMTISGTDLEMRNLNIEKGELSIIGYVTAIEYQDHQLNKPKKEGFLNKLFK